MSINTAYIYFPWYLEVILLSDLCGVLAFFPYRCCSQEEWRVDACREKFVHGQTHTFSAIIFWRSSQAGHNSIKLATGPLSQSKFHHLEHIFLAPNTVVSSCSVPLHAYLFSSLATCTKICSFLDNTAVCFSLLYSFFLQNFGLNISEAHKTQQRTILRHDIKAFFLSALWVEKNPKFTYGKQNIRIN